MERTYNKFPEDGGMVVRCQNGKEKLDLLSFNLKEVVRAHQEPCKEWREQILKT